jgi:large subunit ribosomal protein L25
MELTLTAPPGRTTGSRPSGRLREEGKVPAVVYGLGKDPVSVEVEWTELRRVLNTDAGVNALIDLEVEGETELTLVKELQRHPVRRNVLHVDFLRLDRNAPVAVDVPVVVTGFAKDVEDRRGIVDQQLKSLTVKAKPADIPTELTLDVSELTIGTTITVSELALPSGVTTDVPDDAPVVVGSATRFTQVIDHGGDLDDMAAAEAEALGDESAAPAGDAEAAGEGDAES